MGLAIRPWRDLPQAFGPYTTCYNRLVRWRQAGVWSRIMNALAAAHNAAVQMIDTFVVRVHQHAACIARNRGQAMGRSRGGLTSKIHAVVDSSGLPVQLALTTGEAHDNRLAAKLLSRLKSGSTLLADRGYDADWIRTLVRQHGAWANIPPKSNRKDVLSFSPYLYRARNLVERFFNKIKQCRRVATRYDKLAANYLAFIQLASIRVWLRANESTRWYHRRQFLKRSFHLLSGRFRCDLRWRTMAPFSWAKKLASQSPDGLVHCPVRGRLEKVQRRIVGLS
jgi:transposase